MPSQDTMDFFQRPDPTQNVKPDPQFWIEEVRLLKSFSADPFEQIRKPITFQKGLNIIWAQAPPMNQRKEINFAGHAAGKTTFCRLLRYLLGEHNIAAPSVKEAIEDNFYNGWIIGKIHVDSHPWIVARPLHHATRPRARCLQSDSFEELLHAPEKNLPFCDFEQALHQAVVAPLPVKLFGDGTTDIELSHVLQWFTRDQDCHLTKLHEFRHPDSKSESPNLTSVTAHFLQRIILNLADDDLQKSITECEKLEKQEALIPAEKEYLTKREIELNQSLEKDKIKKTNSPKLTENLIKPARITATNLENKITENINNAIDLANNSLQRLNQKQPLRIENLGSLKSSITTASDDLKKSLDELKALEGKKFDLEIEKDKARKRPPSAYCRVPREVAEKMQCPSFCEWDVLSLNEEDAEKVILSQKEAQKEYIFRCEINLTNFKTTQSELESDIHKTKKDIVSITTKIQDLEKKCKKLQKPFEAIHVNIDDLEQVIKKFNRLQSLEKTLKGDVEQAKKKQETLQKRHLKTENQFVDEYAWTVAQIFGGKKTETKCKFTREKITTKIIYHGKELTSAAITALQILCFDIAAMAFSCRGRGFHPRFLIHDSPREADMGEAPYGRIFDPHFRTSQNK